MPGCNVLFSEGPTLDVAFDAAMTEQRFDSWAVVEPLRKAGPFRAGFTGHVGYPRRCRAADGRFILLEGVVYDRTPAEVDAALGRIAEALANRSPVAAPVRDFVDSTDGDYVVVVYDERGREFVVFNDRWGRLPSYYFATATAAGFSRSVAFLLRSLPTVRFDRIAVAETLMIGHVLGEKTLVEGVFRLPPAGMLHGVLDAGRVRLELSRLVPTVFSSRTEIREEEAVETCAALYMEGLENRVRRIRELGWRITADVTAGRDSRANYVGLNRLGVEAEFYSDDLRGGSECEYLPALEAIYGRPVTRQPMVEPERDLTALSALTYQTDCTVVGGTAWQAEYKASERRRLVGGPAVRLMGFGGEFIRTVSKPPYGYSSISQMVKDDFPFFLFRRREAARLLGLGEKELTRGFLEYFGSYGESSLADQLKHLYFEYYNTLVNAGENRQRRHFWTVVPLWSRGLLDYEMRELPTAMLTRSFFDRFLERIDPRATHAPFLRRGAARGSRRDQAIHELRNLLRSRAQTRYVQPVVRRLREFAAGAYRKASVRTELDKAILERIRPGAVGDGLFDATAVSRVIATRASRARKDHILTILLYADEIARRLPGKLSRG